MYIPEYGGDPVMYGIVFHETVPNKTFTHGVTTDKETGLEEALPINFFYFSRLGIMICIFTG
jgi:hypothetical protein